LNDDDDYKGSKGSNSRLIHAKKERDFKPCPKTTSMDYVGTMRILKD